jgi:hypothetical protein
VRVLLQNGSRDLIKKRRPPVGAAVFYNLSSKKSSNVPEYFSLSFTSFHSSAPQARVCGHWPLLRQFRIQRGKLHLVSRQIILGKNRLRRALGHAQGAVDALFRVDHQEIGTFMETIHGTNVHAIGVFASDTGFGNDVGHGLSFVGLILIL